MRSWSSFLIFHCSLAFLGAEEWRDIWRVCMVMKSIIQKFEGKKFLCPIIFQEKQMTDALSFGNWDIPNLV